MSTGDSGDPPEEIASAPRSTPLRDALVEGLDLDVTHPHVAIGVFGGFISYGAGDGSGSGGKPVRHAIVQGQGLWPGQTIVINGAGDGSGSGGRPPRHPDIEELVKITLLGFDPQTSEHAEPPLYRAYVEGVKTEDDLTISLDPAFGQELSPRASSRDVQVSISPGHLGSALDGPRGSGGSRGGWW